MRKQVQVLENDHRVLFFECPHCDLFIVVGLRDVCCGIFRHGILKESGQHVPPHLNKEECDRLVVEEKVFGCCKPFKLTRERNIWIAEDCDYI